MSPSRETAPRLSVAMIVCNSSDTLAETLESIESIADEIVIADTGSTDETQQIAQRFATMLFSRPWDDDFAAARNHCLSRVNGDWVLWLDAGERLSEETARQLRQFVEDEADPRKAYLLPVAVPASGANIAGERLGCVRLMPNYPGIRFAGRVRERLTRSLAEHGLEVEALPYCIERGAQQHDPEIKSQTARRNIKLADREIAERGPQPRLSNCLGEAFQALGDIGRAAEHYRKALATAEKGSTDMLEAYYGLLTTLDGIEQERQTQLAICLQALETFPLDAQLLCAMGGYLQAQGRWDLATRAYQTAYQYGQVNPETWHVAEIRELAAACYCLSLQLQHKEDDAQRVLEEALESHPQSVRLRRQLIELHVKHSRRDEALQLVDNLPPSFVGLEALRGVIRGACLAGQQNWVPALAYLESAHAAGCRETICLRWLTITLLAVGEHDRARAILHEWQQTDPASSNEVSRYLDAVSSAAESAPAAPRQLRVDRGTSADEQRSSKPNVGTSSTPRSTHSTPQS